MEIFLIKENHINQFEILYIFYENLTQYCQIEAHEKENGLYSFKQISQSQFFSKYVIYK